MKITSHIIETTREGGPGLRHKFYSAREAKKFAAYFEQHGVSYRMYQESEQVGFNDYMLWIAAKLFG